MTERVAWFVVRTDEWSKGTDPRSTPGHEGPYWVQQAARDRARVLDARAFGLSRTTEHTVVRWVVPDPLHEGDR